nr:ATP synthase F0 subunit 8 [Euglandina singleyana]WFQ82723.1 ATP synthase F0 subunit 8 [Euglandina singleyana]
MPQLSPHNTVLMFVVLIMTFLSVLIMVSSSTKNPKLSSTSLHTKSLIFK